MTVEQIIEELKKIKDKNLKVISNVSEITKVEEITFRTSTLVVLSWQINLNKVKWKNKNYLVLLFFCWNRWNYI